MFPFVRPKNDILFHFFVRAVFGARYCSSCTQYTSELFSILENKLIGYADDSTLLSIVPSPGVIVTVAEFLNRDLARGSEWFTFGG